VLGPLLQFRHPAVNRVVAGSLREPNGPTQDGYLRRPVAFVLSGLCLAGTLLGCVPPPMRTARSTRSVNRACCGLGAAGGLSRPSPALTPGQRRRRRRLDLRTVQLSSGLAHQPGSPTQTDFERRITRGTLARSTRLTSNDASHACQERTRSIGFFRDCGPRLGPRRISLPGASPPRYVSHATVPAGGAAEVRLSLNR